ncbi:hypothetical protein SAMD00019534_017340, partial [Acytostelium subglobosum LB1]|uniref:hypothetical protein n=1 Tax=Acytostelium subglobosum LB1 TaxID=1410327 RepID=UPI000644C102
MNRYYNLLPLFTFLLTICIYIAALQVYWFRLDWGDGSKTYLYFKHFRNINSTTSSDNSYEYLDDTESVLRVCTAMMALSFVLVLVAFALHTVLLLGYKKSSSTVPQTSRLITGGALIAIVVTISYFTRLMNSIHADCNSDSRPLINFPCAQLPDGENGFIRKSGTVTWGPYIGWNLSVAASVALLFGLIAVCYITLVKARKRRSYKNIDDEHLVIWNTPL